MIGDDLKAPILVLALSALVSLACAPSPLPAMEYFPGDEDSRWEFEVHLVAGELEMEGVASIYGDGVQVVDGKSYTRVVMDLGGVPIFEATEPSVILSRVSDEGIYARLNERAREFLDTPFPVTLGESWRVDDDDLVYLGEYAALETVMVGGRTYEDCLKVLSSMAAQGQALHQTSHLAPGIGPVRIEMEFPNGVTLDLRLTDYRI